jgi:paraquat-inducible protein A
MTASSSASAPLPTCAVPSGGPVACPWCDQLHERVTLRPGDTSLCSRCGTLLARGHASNWVVTLAWVLTGLILWVPANLLPIVSLSQVGNTRESLLITGAAGLWQHAMPWIAVLVGACGIVAPLLLLLSFTALLLPIVLARPSARGLFLVRWLHAFELWSIPEVYLLAILVAFIKIGSLAHTVPAPGLWCHAGMALALLIAWRRIDVDATAQALATERIKGGVT